MITFLDVCPLFLLVYPLPTCSGLRWFQWQGATGIVAIFLGERTFQDSCRCFLHLICTVILQLRLYALYYGNRVVLVLLCCITIVTIGTSSAMMGIALTELTGEFKIVTPKSQLILACSIVSSDSRDPILHPASSPSPLLCLLDSCTPFRIHPVCISPSKRVPILLHETSRLQDSQELN